LLFGWKARGDIFSALNFFLVSSFFVNVFLGWGFADGMSTRFLSGAFGAFGFDLIVAAGPEVHASAPATKASLAHN
jgi:hypothetical protein